jgi:hypothetical protein
MGSDWPYLCHIRDALIEISSFVEGITYQEYLKDRTNAERHHAVV